MNYIENLGRAILLMVFIVLPMIILSQNLIIMEESK